LDKTKFKVGTLDQLMELNETLVKVDQTLDSTTKKMEKMAKELHPRDFEIEINPQQKSISSSSQSMRFDPPDH
jgi:uncharacterized coiled-coil protein SlyX